MPACYSGPIPVKDEERQAIWRWAKENAIDHGMPIEKVGDAINNHFFAGQAKPEWITDILSGRKTPFRAVANDVWRKQYNRRQIVRQASNLSQAQALGPIGRTVRNLWTGPREIATFGHAAVFPISHAGDLAFRPASWATFFKGIFHTYGGAFNPAHHAQIMAGMERDPMFDTGLRSGVDMGAKSQASGLISKIMGRSSERAWDMLTTMRFELWKRQMEKFMKPDMSNEQVVELGKNMADWANHATGSAKTVPYAGNVLFGPKLTASKLARLFADPTKTIKTFANWRAATPGERAAAWTRLSGASQYAGTLIGSLAVNQGLLWALGAKQQINYTDPTKKDYLAFKLGGMETYFPGMHSEIKTLGKILATAFMNPRDPNLSKYQANFIVGRKPEEIAKILGQYGLSKAVPSASIAEEALTGQNFMGRPLPWSSSPGQVIKKTGKIKPGTERLSWGEYALTHGPIPLSGPAAYVYDKLRQGGASALNSTAIIRGLIISGLGATGLHVGEDIPPSPEAVKAAEKFQTQRVASLKRQETLQQAVGRTRAAQQLQVR
jgi:hypothetical protein